MGSSFDERYTALFVRAERVAGRITPGAAAEDVAAETMIRALVRWGRIEDHAEAWVTTVATNLALDAVRRRRVQLPGRTEPDGTDAVDAHLAAAATIARLPGRQRAAVAMRVLWDLSEDDTAELLGVSVTTVRTHLRRGLRALRSTAYPALEVSDAS